MSESTSGSGRPNETPYPKKKVQLKKGDTTKTTRAANSAKVEDQATPRYRGLNSNTATSRAHFVSSEQAQGSSNVAQTSDNFWQYSRPETQTHCNQIGSSAQQGEMQNVSVLHAVVDDAFFRGQASDLQCRHYDKIMVRGSTIPRILHSPPTLSLATITKGGRVGTNRRG